MRLVERDDEVRALRTVVDRATAGAGSAAVVMGPPGIGKTALLHEVRSHAESRGCRVLSARGGELEIEFPYGAMRQLFEGALRATDVSTRDAWLSGPARPAGALLGGEFADMPSDGPALEHAFYWLTANLAEPEPLVLIVDDAHWLDLASMRSLVYVTRRLADLPVAVILATRGVNGARRSLLERIANEAERMLEPAALTETGVSSLIGRRLARADDAFRHACFSASGGNPFLVTELIGAVEASGVDPLRANAGRVRAVGAQNVMRSVLLRLAGLSEPATPLARAASILGECRQVDRLARLAEVSDRDAAVAIDELRAAHIFAADDPVRFVHSILHDAVYGDVPPAHRSRLHGDAARLLADAGEPADAVAGHLLLTSPGSDPWTLQHLVAAATSGLAVSAPETTAAYLERALQESVTGPARVPLLFGLGGARFQSIDGKATEPLAEALELSTDPALRLELVRALASAYMTENRYDECWQLVAMLRKEYADHPDLAFELGIFDSVAVCTDREDAGHLLSSIREWTPDPSGVTAADRTMLAVQGWVAMNTPVQAEVSAGMARAALSSGTMLDDDIWYPTFEMATWTLIASGCYDEAIKHVDAAVASRRAMGRLLRAGTLLPNRAEAQRRLGRLQLAEEDARLAVEIVPVDQVYAPHTSSVLMLVLLDLGDVEGARRTLVAHGFDSEIQRGGVRDLLWFARGRLRIAEGDVAGGVDDLLRYGAIEESLERRNPAFWPWRSVAAQALVQLGRRDEAAALAERESELATLTGLDEARGRALVALGVARPGAAGQQTLYQAVELLSGSVCPLDLAAAQLALGRALRVDGKREAAREPLRAALDAATRMGAKPLADEAHSELVASGARPRRAATSGIDALTPSERRVASLAARGLTNREIAHTLYVTTKTIEAHLAGAYRKLGVTGKAELAKLMGDAASAPAPV